MIQPGTLVAFEEEVQIKRCFWEWIDRTGEVTKIGPAGAEVLVHSIPPKVLTLPLDRLQELPMAELV